MLSTIIIKCCVFVKVHVCCCANQQPALILVCRFLGEPQWTISCLLLPGLRADNDRWCSHPGGLTGLGHRATVTAFTIGSLAVMAALALVRPGRRVPGGVMTVCGEGIALAATSNSTEIAFSLKVKQ